MKEDYSSHIENVGNGQGLSNSHQEFLLACHGTLDLAPLPAESPRDPLNWPTWRKNVNISLVSFHAMMALFIGAGIIPAYEDIAREMSISLESASYFTSMQFIVHAIAPFFWQPISMRLGLRPIWLTSTFCAAICNVGCALSKSYGAMSISRLLVAFFISPAIALGTSVVTQMFFEHERGQKLGIWTLMVTLGPPLGPLLMGFVAFHAQWRWIFWIFAIVNIVQCFLYLTLSPETHFNIEMDTHRDESTYYTEQESLFRFPPVSRKRITLVDIFLPLGTAKHHVVWIITLAYAQVFNFAFVLLTVEIPQIFGEKFHLNTQQVGLQFIGMAIGGVVGEQAAGPLGDFMIAKYLQKHRGQRAQPEFRLWLSYIGYATLITGLLIWGFRTADLAPEKYDVSPIVGIGISSFGAQVITTSIFAYMVDSYPSESAEIGIFANAIRQTWGFIGPFWFPSMFQSLGIKGSAGIMVGVSIVASLFPVIGVHAFGARMRNAEANAQPAGDQAAES